MLSCKQVTFKQMNKKFIVHSLDTYEGYMLEMIEKLIDRLELLTDVDMVYSCSCCALIHASFT